MKFSHLDSTGAAITTDLSNLDFGEIPAGLHNNFVQTVRPKLDTENTVNDVFFFLEAKGGFSSSNFGFDKTAAFDSSKASDVGGAAFMSTHLTVVANAQASDSASGEAITVAGNNIDMDHVYLDMDVDTLQTGSTTTINYRLVFDFT